MKRACLFIPSFLSPAPDSHRIMLSCSHCVVDGVPRAHLFCGCKLAHILLTPSPCPVPAPLVPTSLFSAIMSLECVCVCLRKAYQRSYRVGLSLS